MDIKNISQTLYPARNWMKLVGVLSIIYGALTALTIVGIVVAWLPIWMGVLLFQSASALERAVLMESADDLTMALAKIRTYFTIMGVLTLIGLVFMILGIFMGGLAGIMATAGK
jgi:hypothetical protein